jgi:hypothetical protein
MTNEELKPCPFCGGEAEINPLALATSDFNVACFNGECPVEPQTRGETKDEAIVAWNTRAIDPATDRIESLKAKLKTSEEIGRAFEEDAGQLRAKLAKATDALKELIFLSNEGDIVDWLNALARAQELMAEIEGE